MQLTSFVFLIFFTLAYGILWMTYLFFHKSRNYSTVNKILLLVFSYVFITWADYRFSLCTFLLTVLVYFCAIGIEKGKKQWLTFGVIVCILQLFLFKYFDFFVSSFSTLFGTQLHITNLFIPLGISFYTFSCISYLVDVYRKKIPANHNFIDVTLFVSFFPKLVSGPIVRPKQFFSQLEEGVHVSKDNLCLGIQMAVCGLFKKIVLADHLCVFTDNVFSAPSVFSAGTLLLGVLAYAFQIYLDFSGYSDISIGLSKMMGFSFDLNFNLPYISKNPSEFWKRWHISLSTWLRDYLYIPLGGNRKGTIRTYINLFLTMVLGGLWHGANWTFLIWGALNGFALILHKIFSSFKAQRNSCWTVMNIFSVIFNFTFVSFLWVFFRADSVQTAWLYLSRIFLGSSGVFQPFSWVFISAVFLLAEFTYCFYFSRKKQTPLMQRYLLLNLSNVLQLALFFTMIGIIIITGYFGSTAFIYAAF